jgi:hypothetical protein
MATGTSRRKPNAVPEAAEALQRLKYEIASELGLPVGLATPGGIGSSDAEFAAEPGMMPAPSVGKADWGHIAARDAGAVGGELVRRLVRRAQSTLDGNLHLSIDRN